MRRKPNQVEIERKQGIHEWLACKPVGQAFQPATHYPELQELTRESIRDVWQRCRRLPHWELEGSTYFITFRVDSALGTRFLPSILHAIERYRPAPDKIGRNPTVGQASPIGQASRVGQAFQPADPAPDIASLLEESIFFGYAERYILDAYVIMPDHAHLLFTPLHGWTLAKIQQGLKGFTSWEINGVLGRRGRFWQDESFDHLIRDEVDWLDKFTYIHNNPVKAGLVERPEDYPFSSLVTLHSRGRMESLLRVLAG